MKLFDFFRRKKSLNEADLTVYEVLAYSNLVQILNEIDVSISFEVKNLIKDTGKEIFEQQLNRLKANPLSLVIKEYKESCQIYQKIIIDKCAPILEEACLKKYHINFRNHPLFDKIVKTINDVAYMNICNIYQSLQNIKE